MCQSCRLAVNRQQYDNPCVEVLLRATGAYDCAVDCLMSPVCPSVVQVLAAKPWILSRNVSVERRPALLYDYWHS